VILGDADGVSRFRTNIRDLLVQGITAVKAGDVEEAHFYLEWALRKDASDDERAQAWYWLSQVYADPGDQRECLAYALAIDPANPLARRALAILDGRLKPQDIIDPDRLRSTGSNDPVEASARQFLCPRCGSSMRYSPDGAGLECAFCSYREGDNPTGRNGGTYGDPDLSELEQDFITALATARGHRRPSSMRTFHCQACGTGFILAPETHSLTCPYCETVYVTEAADSQDIVPPQGLIPFSFDREKAELIAHEWLDGQGFVSNITGIYVPAWTFDLHGEISWQGLEPRGDDWVPVSGNYYVLHDDLVVPAGENIAAHQAKCVRSYDLRGLVAYDAKYLADWPATRYQKSVAEASLKARRRVLEQLRRQPYKLTGGRIVRDLRLNSRGLAIDSFKLILLPMWIAHFRRDGNLLEAVINGQSGVVWGDRAYGLVGKLMSWFKGESR